MRISYAVVQPVGLADDTRFLRPALSSGYLAAYLTARRGDRDQHDIVSADELQSCHSPTEVAARLQRDDPQLIALSVYVWNRDAVAEVIDVLREQRSPATIVLGGPEVAFAPDQALDSLRADWVCTGEGERPFHALVEHLDAEPRFGGQVPGMRSSRTLVDSTAAPLVDDLDTIPSPFQTGLLDVPASGWIDYESLRGCPYQCAFCLYGKNYASMRFLSLERVAADVDWMLGRGATNLYFLDPTFNLPRNRSLDILRLLGERNGDRQLAVHIEARAELVDERMADALLEAGVTTVEVGLQAVDARVLEVMHRRLGADAFVNGCRLLRERGIEVEIGVILGLPEDTPDSVRRTVEFATREPLGRVWVYRLQVLPGSAYQRDSAQLGLRFDDQAPYWVRSTPQMAANVLDRLEAELADITGQANRRYEATLAQPVVALAHEAQRKLAKAKKKLATPSPVGISDGVGLARKSKLG